MGPEESTRDVAGGARGLFAVWSRRGTWKGRVLEGRLHVRAEERLPGRRCGQIPASGENCLWTVEADAEQTEQVQELMSKPAGLGQSVSSEK